MSQICLIEILLKREVVKATCFSSTVQCAGKVLLIVEWVERRLMYGEVMAKTGTAFSSEIGDKTKNICAKC